MFLRSITLHGFKSFATKATLTFDARHSDARSMTAVVGPNGSGKSNIADAVRWVLGEQSVKLLRGKKSEDVVFAGSSKKARMGMAEVTLIINNHDRAFPLDFEEITIRRCVYRNGGSEYLLNHEPVRLVDLQLLLAKAGIGGRSYAVIGQGMIDNVLVATPVERKDFFDDAAGVKEFEIRRRHTELKLNATQENLYTARIIIEELEPRVKALSRAMKKLEAHDAIVKELRTVTVQYFSGAWHALSRASNEIAQREEIVTTKVEEARSTQKMVLQKLSALEKKVTAGEALLQLQQQYEETRKERNVLYDELTRLRTALEIEKTRVVAKVDDRHIPIAEVKMLFDELLVLHNELAQHVHHAQSIEQLEPLREVFLKFESKLNELANRYVREEKKEKHKKDDEASSRIDALHETMRVAEMKLAQLSDSMRAISRDDHTKKSSFFELQRAMQDATAKVHAQEQELNTLKVERARIDTRRETLQEEMQREAAEYVNDIKSAAMRDEGRENEHALHARMYQLKHQLEIIGSIDAETVSEYKEAHSRFTFLTAQVEDLTKAAAMLTQGLSELDEEMHSRRKEVLGRIAEEFDRYFKQLFLGGSASLVPLYVDLTADVDDSEKEKKIALREKELTGIEIHAQPPGKRIKDIAMLSGGERALTSVALICAILKVNPSPFVVLDEVDAALDEANSSRFAEILEHLSEKTQFIVVTHNRSTMMKSKALYGVSMGDDGVSQLFSVELANVSAWAK